MDEPLQHCLNFQSGGDLVASFLEEPELLRAARR
jgi:hypothetical protein